MIALDWLQAAAERPAPARSWWEFVLLVMGAILTTVALLGVVARVARPHVDRYLRLLIEPIAEAVTDVHEEVKPNHGTSMKDQAGRIDERVQDVAASLSRLHRRVDSVHERLTRVDARGRVVEGILQQHLDESRRATRVLRRHGIETGDHGEDET